MPLINVIVILVVVGVVLYLLQTYIPMAQPIKTLITVLVILFVCVWLLQLFGVVGYHTTGYVGRVG